MTISWVFHIISFYQAKLANFSICPLKDIYLFRQTFLLHIKKPLHTQEQTKQNIWNILDTRNVQKEKVFRLHQRYVDFWQKSIAVDIPQSFIFASKGVKPRCFNAETILYYIIILRPCTIVFNIRSISATYHT